MQSSVCDDICHACTVIAHRACEHRDTAYENRDTRRELNAHAPLRVLRCAMRAAIHPTDASYFKWLRRRSRQYLRALVPCTCHHMCVGHYCVGHHFFGYSSLVYVCSSRTFRSVVLFQLHTHDMYTNPPEQSQLNSAHKQGKRFYRILTLTLTRS